MEFHQRNTKVRFFVWLANSVAHADIGKPLVMTLHCLPSINRSSVPVQFLFMVPPASPATSSPILRIAIPVPLRKLFDYLPPLAEHEQLVPGVRVQVPFGRRQLIGLVVTVAEQSTVPTAKLRPISRVIDRQPLLPGALFRTLLWAADYYQHPVGEVFQAALPVKLRRGEPDRHTVIRFRLRAGVNLADTALQLQRAPRQLALLQLLARHASLTASAVREQGFDLSLLHKLVQRKLIIGEQVPAQSPQSSTVWQAAHDGIRLNDSQQTAVAELTAAEGFAVFLLHGVTGSGKTEVYIRAMEPPLRAGRQCLLLVPEIGLTPQTVARFEQRFSCPVVSLHSGLNDTERATAWRAANSGQAGIIIGTRSAVFTPLASAGLIIVDEEHDGSFKQQKGFHYSARDVAIKRAQTEGIPIILGSATPSLESIHNAHQHKYRLLQLQQRAGGAEKAPLQIIDSSGQSLDGGFAELLLLKIRQHLLAGNQVLVFINRRGYAPTLQCRACGWIGECRHCIARLTVHAQPPSLRCHHCEVVLPLPSHCPNCHAGDLYTLGAGTQQLEQFLSARFQDYPVMRIDRDSTRGKRKLHALLHTINQGRPSILLGTQMLAKGHHFPAVTLVVILDADIGLFSADFRGQEHMAQTIVQVAGRAGRAARAGEVLVQSRHASHPALNGLATMSYEEYARRLLAERQAAAMPPYSHLALLRVEAGNKATVWQAAEAIAATAAHRKPGSVETIGPVPAPMEKRAGRYRLQLLFKSGQRTVLQPFLRRLCAALDELKLPAQSRWSLDVDPMDLL